MRRPEELLLLLASAMAHGATTSELPRYVCCAASQTLGCDAASITLNDRGPGRVTLCTTDDAALTVVDAEEIVGEGPAMEAYRSGQPVTLRIDDDENGLLDPRWPLLATTGLRDAGPLVVHAVPLGPPDGVFGVLTLIQRGVGHELDPNSARDVSQLVAAVVLASAPTAVDDLMREPWNLRDEIYQATGMVMAQMRVGEDDALALLRAHAFATGIGLQATAHDVLQRRLRFGRAAGEEMKS